MAKTNKWGTAIRKTLMITTVLFVTLGSLLAAKRFEIITYRFNIPKDVYNKAQNNERFQNFKMAIKCNDPSVKFPRFEPMGQHEGNYSEFCGAKAEFGYWVFVKPYLIIWTNRLDGDNYTDHMNSLREREKSLKHLSSTNRQGYMSDIMRNNCIENCMKNNCRGYTMERTIKPCADSCRTQCK